MADPLTHDRRVRLRFAVAAFVMTVVIAGLIGFATNRVLDPPWSLVSVPVGWAIGWWAGKRVITPLMFGRRDEGDQ